MATKKRKGAFENIERGALHRRLGIPEDKKIPLSRINKEIAELERAKERQGKLTAEQRKFLRQLIFARNEKTGKFD